MTCGIYEIINKQDGTVYIGQSMDIERRWKVHLQLNPLNTNLNLKPTLELYHENRDLVEFNIVYDIYEKLFDENEIKFVLSVYEKHELELRGGHKSDKVINERPISIPAVPPSILLNESLPDFVSNDDLLFGISKWQKEEIHRNMYRKSRELGIVNPQSDEIILDLEDEVASLENQVNFWKARCAYWRKKHGSNQKENWNKY